MATIATHNGHTAHREHNIRNPRVVSKEAHINPHGNYEIWLDIPPRKAYEELFGDAVKEYNERQTRADRKINDYYDDICKDKKKHAVYEMICGVYDENVTADTAHEILFDFVADWERRNPNLFLCGAYYHADEDGQPHVHIDYVPFVDGYTRGMSRQNGLVKALGQQGFFKRGKETAQIAWERRENDYLAHLCEVRGISVTRCEADRRAHMDTQTYKATKALKSTQNAVDELTERLSELNDDADRASEELNLYRRAAEAEKARADSLAAEVARLQDVSISLELECRQKQSKNDKLTYKLKKTEDELSECRSELVEARRSVSSVKNDLEYAERKKRDIEASSALKRDELEKLEDELVIVKTKKNINNMFIKYKQKFKHHYETLKNNAHALVMFANEYADAFARFCIDNKLNVHDSLFYAARVADEKAVAQSLQYAYDEAKREIEQAQYELENTDFSEEYSYDEEEEDFEL